MGVRIPPPPPYTLWRGAEWIGAGGLSLRVASISTYINQIEHRRAGLIEVRNELHERCWFDTGRPLHTLWGRSLMEERSC